MQSGWTVQVLGAGDAALLRAMSGVFAREFNEPQTYLSSQPPDEYLAGLLGRDTFVAVAALLEGRVIGGLAGYVLPKFEQCRSELYIYDLAVDAAYRRRGVATALIRRLQLLARERGIYVIYVQADLADAPAIALYSGLGRREDVLHFDMDPA